MKAIGQIAVDDLQPTMWRTLQTFCATRVVIAVMLLAYLSVSTGEGFWVTEKFLYREACALYVLQAIMFFVLSVYEKRRFRLQLITGIAIDIFLISILYLASGGTKSGLAILYLFPLAGGAILAPLTMALFFTSIVAVILLLENWYQFFQMQADTSMSQAGLYGAAFFAAAYFINRLAARLLRQEELALQRGRDLYIQQAINHLVIADMGDGILVLDGEGTVHITNPAAERMLGLSATGQGARYRLSELPFLQPIAQVFAEWREKGGMAPCVQNELPAFVRIRRENFLLDDRTLPGGMSRPDPVAHLKLKFATVETETPQEERVVIFLQDVSEIENRAQQLKLASMGRLTASIAHEVRNPLSAVSHAASLLKEDVTETPQKRLLSIIEDNVGRLNRMIEDILKLSRKAQSQLEPIDLSKVIEEIVTEFEEMHSVKPGLIQIGAMRGYRVLFDPLHLREILANLMGNALRYASGANGSIQVYLVIGLAGPVELHVQDDGPPISAQVRAHLFEPFYTTSSKGTGLGLYVARELCANNGAMLDYEHRTDSAEGPVEQATGRFVITFSSPGSA
jgi:two-component system sensor histidine kinase PilS (NtrC family)